MFDDKFLNLLPDNGYEAAKMLCEEFFKLTFSMPEQVRRKEQYANFVAAFGVAQALVETYSLPVNVPSFSSDRNLMVGKIYAFFTTLQKAAETEFARTTLEKAKNKFALRLGRTFHYEFSEGDLNRVQELISEIRQLILDSKIFEDDHRSRLLCRLEKVQSELHKKVSDLDKFWGLIGDAGVVLGKFGTDAKPIFDRIRDLTMLIWATQSRAEGLASNCPPPLSLPPPSPDISPNPGGSEPSSTDV